MNKAEFEELLEELDEALVQAFPDPHPIKALVVGGACLLFTEVISRPTKDIDLIIWDLMGTDEDSLIFTTPVATKIRKIISQIGKRHGLKGEEKMFFNDDCAPFLLELGGNELPEMRLFRAYRRMHLYLPNDLTYILACKLMAGRADKDFSDIAALCRLLDIETREQAQQAVDAFFPSLIDQRTHLLPTTLETLFGS
jgi:hypothetical protein